MIARLCAAAAAAALTILAGSTASWAGEKPDTSHREVCHPKAGGWVLINPAQASSHIDEATGAPKHEHSGRVDVYTVNGACPTIPTTTPTGGTPSKTTTATASPSSNSSTPTRTETSPAKTSAPSSTAPTTTRAGRTTSSTPFSTPTPGSRLTNAPSSTAELAATGSSLDAAVVAAFLLTVGGLLKLASRRKGAHQ